MLIQCLHQKSLKEIIRLKLFFVRSGGHFFGEVALESDGCCLLELGHKRCNEVKVDLDKVKRYEGSSINDVTQFLTPLLA